jgi:ABC-2 type transport system ATP-binding protein
VLLSTHIVSDIEKCADRVMVIKDGQRVFDGTEEETGKDLEAFYLDIFGGED